MDDRLNSLIVTLKNKFSPMLLAILLLLLALGAFGVWFFTQKSSGKLMVSPFSQLVEKMSVTEKYMNPITGEQLDKGTVNWAGNRPLGVMVNNHIDARPQTGLSRADIVYEMVAEGGITRFLAFFLSDTPKKIGPVRSTREYYLVLVKELGDAMIMHIGWSPQALEAIQTWPVRSLGRGGAEFWRENPNNVATEHTAYVDGEYLRKLGDTLGWGGTAMIDPWLFKPDKDGYPTAKAAFEVSIDFWYKGDYSSGFKYNPTNNTYIRLLGYDEKDQFQPQIDNETKAPIEVKNALVQFVAETPITGDDKNRLTYQLVGSGEALVFIDGKVIPATWSKSERDSRTKFYDQNGGEFRFNRGKFWVSIVPDRNKDLVVY